MKEGYDTANISPGQVTLKGSFDTNSTGAPLAVRGRFDVVRTGVGVFRIRKALDSRNAPTATYTRFESYQIQVHGTTTQDSKLYEVRVTAEDVADARPYVDVTVYIRTYGVGTVDTYVAAETTNMKICFELTLLEA